MDNSTQTHTHTLHTAQTDPDQHDHVTVEVSPDSGNILSNNKGIMPVIQMLDTSSTAVSVTLSVSAAAALQQ